MTRYIIGVDEGGPEGFNSFVCVDQKTKRVVWQETQRQEEPFPREPRLPWWLLLRMFFGQVSIIRETDDFSPEVLRRITL